MIILNKAFNVFLPFDKVSKSEDDNDTCIVEGYASTSDRDLQSETILPSGIDDSYLIDNGWIDYEHDTDQVIGVPTKNTHVDQHGLYLQAKLFKNMPQVQDIMKLYHNIKDNGIDRNLGFSIEGNVLERDDNDESIIRQVQITGVAVTKNPANTHATWELVSKSLFSPQAGLGDEQKATNKNNPMLSMTVKIDKSANDKDNHFNSSTYGYSFDNPTSEKTKHTVKDEEKKKPEPKEPTNVSIGGEKGTSVDHADKALTAGHGITPSAQSNGAAFRTEQFSDQIVSIADNLKMAKQIGLEKVAPTIADILQGKDADDNTLTVFLQLFTGISDTEAQAIVQALQTKTLTTQRLQNLLGSSDDTTDDVDDDD